MSNITTPFGLRPVRYKDGSPWNGGGTIRTYIHASYAAALFIGDPVTWASELDYKDTTAKYPSIKIAAGTAASMLNGVIVSFEPRPATTLEQIYSPASTEGWANIVIDENVVFQIRDDGAGTPSKVYVGQNATLTAGSGSTVTGLSAWVMDTSTPAADQTAPLFILGLADIPGNELADYAVWEVLINTMTNAGGRYLGVTAT